MSEKESCLSSSNRFKIKVILVWLIICVPGNIFAIICIYSSKTNYTFISEQNYTNPAWHQKPIENLNASRDSERNETTIRDFRNQATIEIPNSSEVVSKFYNISNITQLYFIEKQKRMWTKWNYFLILLDSTISQCDKWFKNFDESWWRRRHTMLWKLWERFGKRKE